MTEEKGKIVRTSVAVVIALCLVIVAIVGVPWDASDESAANRTADVLSEKTAIKSCGDFQIPGPVRHPPVEIEVVQGDVPCRVALGVMKDVYVVVDGELRNPSHTGSWSCGWPVTAFIKECEKSQGGAAAIRARFHCGDWGAARPYCLDRFGPDHSEADADAVQVIDDWTDELRAGDVPAASERFAIPSVVQNGTPPLRLTDRGAVEAFNRSLPCGGKLNEVKKASTSDPYTIATFELTERPGPGECGTSVGETAKTAFVIRDGLITEWHRVADLYRYGCRFRPCPLATEPEPRGRARSPHR